MVAASVRVEYYHRNKLQMGSGTIVVADSEKNVALVLTCRHVIPAPPGGEPSYRPRLAGYSWLLHEPLYTPKQTGDRIVVVLPSGKRYQATWLAVDPRADLAACSIVMDEAAFPCRPVSDRAPAPGEAVWQVGYPGGRGPTPRNGFFRRYMSAPDVEYNMAIASGDSGSGVFRPSDGSLVGVLWGATPGAPVAVATGHADVSRFVTACHRWVRPRKPAPPPVMPSPPTPPPITIPDGPAPAPLPPVVQDPALRADLDRVKDEIAQIQKSILGLLAERDKLVEAVASGKGDLLQAKGKLEMTEGQLGKLQLGLESLGLHQGAYGDRLGKAEEVLRKTVGELLKPPVPGPPGPPGAAVDPAVAAELAKVASWAGWLPAIAGGAASGGALPLILMGIQGWSSLRRRQGTAPARSVGIPGPAGETMYVPVPGPPGRDTAKFIHVEGDNREAVAMHDAMADMLRQYPGASGTLEILEGMWKQRLSGQEPKKGP